MLSLRKILCPTDFSDFSRHATAKAGELAAHFGAQMCLLHVTQPIQLTVPYLEAVTDATDYEKAAREGAERELHAMIAGTSLADVTATPLLRRGNAAEEIVAAAAQEEADLIVITTHGLTGWRRHIFGSVAEKILRMAHCPVLILRAKSAHEPLLPLQTIVCATDFSEPSFAALNVAGQWAQHFDAPLCVVHAVEPMQQPGFFLDKSQIESAIQTDAAQQLQRVIEERLPGAAVRPIVRVGSAADEIAAAAHEEKAGLIVIATHGAGGWGTIVSGTAVEHILFGSVTTNVLRLSSCPILTVRMPVPDS